MVQDTMRSHFTLILLSWLCSVCTSLQIHNHMTIDEIRSTFHVDSHAFVPEYELIPIHQIEKRSLPDDKENLIDEPVIDQNQASPPRKFPEKKHLTLKIFGKPFTLSLAPTEGLLKKGKLKIWTIEPNATAQHGIEYVEIPDEPVDEIGEIYQDEENQAAILMRKEKDGLVLEGSIGSHLIIRPLPPRLRGSVIPSKNKNLTDSDTVNDDEMFLDQDGDLSSEVAIDTGLPIRRNKAVHHHIIIKRKQVDDDGILSDYAMMEPDHISKRYKRNSENESRRKREAPYTIYPEILVIVDYDGYRLHGGDNLQVKRYFVSFWNGVDLRYKLLKGPKVRISIAGIIISRGRDATPYLERNRVGRDAIDSAAALTDMGKYLFRERRLPVYDIAVAITKLDMCRRSFPNDHCNRGTAGFAYVGGACVVNKRLEKVNSVAIIEDTGGFSGIIVAAHEVGHLLGAVHDGSPPPSYLGGPGAEKCQWTDGYIMSDLRHTERGFRWSSCSVASFHHFLNGDTATCLYNAPHEDESLPRVLPGKLLTLDAQCRKDRGTSACFKDDRVCAQLFCFDAGSGYCVAYRPAAEGSPCGDGQYCLNGRCVAEHENIIPDYSQNTPSYVRPNGNSGRPLSDNGQEELIYQNPTQPYQNNPYDNHQFQISRNSFQNPYNPITTTTQRFIFTSVSTTRSPYNFNQFATQKPTPFSNPLLSSVNPNENSFLGNYFNTLRKTTKNPYDFGNFGKTTQNPFTQNFDNIDNNYLKRSYNIVSYYSDSSNLNKTVMNGRLSK